MSAEYWNQVAEQKVFRHPLRLDWIKPQLSRESTIVDLGCGYGRLVNELSEAGFTNAAGLDSSKAMIQRAKRENPQLSFGVADARSTELADRTVDAVLLFAVLTSIPESEQQRRVIDECARILRPGGLLYVSDLLLSQDERNVQRYDRFESEFGTRGVFRLDDGGVMRHHDPDWFAELFEPFECKHEAGFEATTMNGNQAVGYQFLGALLHPNSPQANSS